MRPSSLREGAALCVALCLSVCPSVCLSVRLSVSVRPVIVIERHVAPPSELQWHTCTFRTRWGPHIVYGHLGRTNSCFNWNS